MGAGVTTVSPGAVAGHCSSLRPHPPNLEALLYSSARGALDPSWVNPPGRNILSCVVIPRPQLFSALSGGLPRGRGAPQAGDQQEARAKTRSPNPALSEAPPSIGTPQGRDRQERGPQGWGGSRTSGPPPCPSACQAREGPTVSAPPTPPTQGQQLTFPNQPRPTSSRYKRLCRPRSADWSSCTVTGWGLRDPCSGCRCPHLPFPSPSRGCPLSLSGELP